MALSTNFQAVFSVVSLLLLMLLVYRDAFAHLSLHTIPSNPPPVQLQPIAMERQQAMTDKDRQIEELLTKIESIDIEQRRIEKYNQLQDTITSQAQRIQEL